MKQWIIAVVVAVAGLSVAAVAFFMQGDVTYERAGGSMAPAIPEGADVEVRPLPGDQVHRGDIVLFDGRGWGPEHKGDKLLKRVVAVGGDTVEGAGTGPITVNGKKITEPYVSTKGFPTEPEPYQVTLKQGEVFVAGDVRDNSVDSRMFTDLLNHGAIPVQDISGVVVSVDGQKITPTTAFTDAGLAGAPYQDDSTGAARLLAIAGGLALFVGGVVWLIVAVNRRKRVG